MVGDGLIYAEYFVEDASEGRNWQSRMADLRDWDVCVKEKTSISEINLEIKRLEGLTKWRQYTTISLDLLDEQSKHNIDTVHMLVADNTAGAEVKNVFIDFQRFVYRGELFKTLEDNQTGRRDDILWLNRWMTTRMEMLTFYRSNGEKLLNESPITASGAVNSDCRISVVQKTLKQIDFIPAGLESQLTKESIVELLSQKHILIRCITDDELAWAVTCDDCKTIADVETRLQPFVLNGNKGRLMLVGDDGQLLGDDKIDKLGSVIHYAVVLPYENVTKISNIGRGAFGMVSRCKIGNETTYAMKEMEKCENEKEEDKIGRINEVMVAARIGCHPNIVKYRYFYEDVLAFYIVMDCMNESLYNHIKKKHPLEEVTIISFAKQILEGLKHLHDMKVIHRDMKSQNVLLDENGWVKLCDFGVSKCQNVNTNKAGGEGGKTQKGTQRYMAPELIGLDRPDKYGQSADVWSFGLVMVEMITGKEPFPDLSDTQVHLRLKKDKKVKYKFPDLYSLKLKQFVDSCLVYVPQDRPTCGELLRNIIFLRIKTAKLLKKEVDEINIF